MSVYLWETTARYMFDKTQFRLSIPYNHHIAPIIVSVQYIPRLNRIEIIGTITEPLNSQTMLKMYKGEFVHRIAESRNTAKENEMS